MSSEKTFKKNSDRRINFLCQQQMENDIESHRQLRINETVYNQEFCYEPLVESYSCRTTWIKVKHSAFYVKFSLGGFVTMTGDKDASVLLLFLRLLVLHALPSFFSSN